LKESERLTGSADSVSACSSTLNSYAYISGSVVSTTACSATLKDYLHITGTSASKSGGSSTLNYHGALSGNADNVSYAYGVIYDVAAPALWCSPWTLVMWRNTLWK
jgi:hypothetical protein